jgi:hypothetical protein
VEGDIIIPIQRIDILLGADLDRIGLLGKPPTEQHSFPSKSQ